MSQYPSAPCAAQRGGLAHLDGIRGVVLASLLLFHAPSNTFTSERWSWLGERAFAVAFVLLGYWLMLEAGRNPAALPRQRVARFAWRVLGPYYVALIATLALAPDAPSWGATLSHFALVHPWLPRWTYSIAPSFWAVGVAWHAAVLFAFVLAPLWRRRGTFAVLLVSAALAGIPLAVAFEVVAPLKPWTLFLVALGMLAAAVSFSAREVERELRENLVWRSETARFAASGALMAVFAPERAITGDLIAGVAAASALVWLTQAASVPSERGYVLRALETRGLVALGKISYGVYLCHGACWAALGGPLALPAAVGCGALFHLTVERLFSTPLRARTLRRAAFAATLLASAAISAQSLGEWLDRDAIARTASYIGLGDKRIRYVLQNPDAAEPTVVFLNTMQPLEQWEPIRQRLSPRVPTLAYDRCNMGFSRGDFGCTVGQAADELNDVLSTLSRRRVVLVGYSVSGLLVRGFVQKYGARVEGVILIDPRSPEALHAFGDELDLSARYGVDKWLWGEIARAVTGLERLHATYSSPLRAGSAGEHTLLLAQRSAKHWWAAWRAFRDFDRTPLSEFDPDAFAGTPAELLTIADARDGLGQLMLDGQRAAIDRAPVRRIRHVPDVAHEHLLQDRRSTAMIAEMISDFVHERAVVAIPTSTPTPGPTRHAQL